jgi:twitching motility protein PilT
MNITDINVILDKARDLNVSDVHFTAGLPPIIRQHGSIKKLAGLPGL